VQPDPIQSTSATVRDGLRTCACAREAVKAQLGARAYGHLIPGGEAEATAQLDRFLNAQEAKA
jgi:hypothetical protein